MKLWWFLLLYDNPHLTQRASSLPFSLFYLYTHFFKSWCILVCLSFSAVWYCTICHKRTFDWAMKRVDTPSSFIPHRLLLVFNLRLPILAFQLPFMLPTYPSSPSLCIFPQSLLSCLLPLAANLSYLVPFYSSSPSFHQLLCYIHLTLTWLSGYRLNIKR